MSKNIIYDIFGIKIAELIWTRNFLKVYPATFQNFSVGSLLPAVFYMFRRGWRRGKGCFKTTFTPAKYDGDPTIFFVAQKLATQEYNFVGFDDDLKTTILGDLLLTDALENKKHQEGQNIEVQRVYPVHYFSSWIDLPYKVADLRFVPEMLVALLANQNNSKCINNSPFGDFPVGKNPKNNLLFKVFGRGTIFEANPADLTGETIDETGIYSIEELLMIRLAQTCGQAPEKIAGKEGKGEIPNLHPLSKRATDIFRSDLTTFLKYYGETIPRRAITPMLESIIGFSIWHSFLSSLVALVEWEKTGVVPTIENQKPFEIFVDASSGLNADLRIYSEESLEQLMRFVDEATIALACARILDAKARFNNELSEKEHIGPDSSEWLNLLGDVRHSKHPQSPKIIYDLEEKKQMLKEQELPNEILIMLEKSTSKDPVRILAEIICEMMGHKLLRSGYISFLDSSGMANEPHGMIRKRRTSKLTSEGRRRLFEARSFTLSNTLLDVLVHRYIAERKPGLSYDEFLKILKVNYGLYIDEAPPGLIISRVDLHKNREILEQRLRDLGLLVGVNDAESMKHLKPRYRIKEL